MRSMARRAGRLALAIILGSTIVVVDAGAGSAGTRHAAGTYTATFPDTATSSALVITNADGSTKSGTFEFVDFGDFGTWVAQGATVAFLVSASSVGHEGSVLIAKLSSTGLDPGEFDSPGVAEQPWSATRVAAASASTSASADASRAPLPSSVASTAAVRPWVYDAVFDGTVDDTLTLVHNDGTTQAGIFGLTNLQDLGVWAKLGKKIVLGITSGADAGIVLVGTQTKTAIGTPDAPGAYYQQSTGVHPWYATRVTT
jgi:hypothetical protein